MPQEKPEVKKELEKGEWERFAELDAIEAPVDSMGVASFSADGKFIIGNEGEDVKVLNVLKTDKLIDVLVEGGMVESKSEFRRLVEAGAVSDFPDKKVTNPNQEIGEVERKIKIGKRVFVVLKV